MLQPRRPPPPGYLCVLLCLCAHLVQTGNADDWINNRIQNGERIRRHDGEVTILSLDENAKSPQALGILSSTARTFVHGGTTTEFSTQVLGTTIGKTYVRLLSTGSRVFYDNTRPASKDRGKPTDAFLVFPTLLQKPSFDSASISPSELEEVLSTKSLESNQRMQEIIDNHEAYNRLAIDDLFDLSDTKHIVQKAPGPVANERENVVSVRKEYSVKRNSDIKPAKVNANYELPTYTVRHEFAPSGFSLDNIDEKKDDIVKPSKRNGKALFRGGVAIKQDKKLDTVTYFGFADFTTTVGDTVIVFMPKTPDPHLGGAVTSIQGEATLRPEDAAMPVVTTVKTFMSHSPGMATKTVTGHSLSMQTSLPTVQADPAVRESKAYEPVYKPEINEDRFGGFGIQSLSESSESIQPSLEMDIKSPEITATEPLSTFATTKTQIYNSAENALGLVKSIGGTEAYDGTTTVFTSFVVGTVIDGAYKQLTQSASSVFINVGGEIITTTGVGINIAPTSVSDKHKPLEVTDTTPGTDINTTEDSESATDKEDTTSENELSNEIDAAKKINSSSQDKTVFFDDIIPESTKEYITQIVPSTVYKTFTYLTTFFIPDEKGGQTTSIRSREVTSEEISYQTKFVDSDDSEPTSATIVPSEVTTEVEPTTTPQEVTTVTEESKTEGTTPQLPVTNSDLITTTQPMTTEIDEDVEKTTPSSTPKTQDEEEVDLIFKTLYTTYTYLTTFFQESSTSVSSREVVVTNVITTTLDNNLASDPAVAGLFNKDQATNFPLASSVLEPAPTSVGIGRPTTKYFEDLLKGNNDELFTSTLESVDIEKELQAPTPALDSINEITDDALKTFYTTYTYFTTVFVDGETEVESRTEVYTNVIGPSSQTPIKQTSPVPLFSSDYVSVLPDEQVESPEDFSVENQKHSIKITPTRLYDSTISRPKIKDNEIAPVSEAHLKKHGFQPTNIDDAYKYDTTMSRIHSNENNQADNEEDLMDAKQKELSKEEKLLLGITSADDPEIEQKIVVDVTSSSSGRSRKVYRESYDDPDDQITSESNTEEIEPSFSPTILLQTSYTTFTYFTTVYKGTSSDVISRLDTVTNVVTETLRPSDIDASLSPEEATLPITYFTTFTYWTTLYKDGSTMVTSREETISNIVTPTVSDLPSIENIDITPTKVSTFVLPTVMTSVVGENAVDSPIKPKYLDPSNKESVTDPEGISPSLASSDTTIVGEPKEKSSELPASQNLEPTTFYTTYTYFTTSYVGNNTILNSRLETVTNIVSPTSEGVESSDEIEDNSIATKKTDGPVLKPTGLISTIRTSEINNGITTLLSTDVFGTYIDGLYAQVLESSTQIVTPNIAPVSTLSVSGETQPTGVVSINEGKVVDADGVSTTFFTTKAVGTYIDKLYAQVIESTTSIQVDDDRKTAVKLLDPSTTIVGSKTYRTGLVRLIEGSIVKDRTTTFYESRVIGTLIEGRYAQIIESTSSFKIEMSSTPVADISATSVFKGGVAIAPTATVSSSPSPVVIESSIGDGEGDHDDDENEDEDDDDGLKGRSKSRLSFSSRKKSFTPVIRPFASRPRPTFLPKKKTGDVGSATTVTRNGFTPTITATPAVKSSDRGFGSSRNRFAGGRKSSTLSATVAATSASAGRRFSGRRGSTSAVVNVSPSINSSSYRGRSSGRIVSPTATSSFGSSSRRGSFNYRTSSGLRSSSVLPGSSRLRIRPTLSGSRPTPTITSTTEDVINTNDIGSVTVVTEETLATLQDEEQETSPPSTTTTESPRRSNNPLLRFRRPPILQRSSTTTTTPKPTTPPARKSNLLRRPDSRGAATTPVTPARTRPSPTFPPRNRQRTSNNLFPPRGLLRKPTPAEEAEEEEEEDDKEGKIDDNEQTAKLDEENEFNDNDYDGSEHSESQHSTNNATSTTELPKSDRKNKSLSQVSIRQFKPPGLKRQRTKRQAIEWGARRSRYQRPTTRVTSYDYYVDDSEPLPSETPTTRTPTRFKPRSREQVQSNQQNQYGQHSQYNQHSQQTQSRVRPTKASSTSERSQFTLRDKTAAQSQRSGFKRPTSSRRRPTSTETTTTPQRPKPPRLRTQPSQPDSTHTSRNSGRRYSNSRRTTNRSRYRDNSDDSYSFSPTNFDGTITVTHQVPTEATIPVVNGKVTEYKNIITAKPSLEVLGPYQYTTTTGKAGNILIQLTSEVVNTLPNGVMEVTKFLVYETPTTSITFTPTTLRGRKTSFSHIVPSTVYDVKPEVSTIQPQIAANAPLANLLLSQLLLGNLNLQPNAQPINPLLGLQNQPVTPQTPTTEFKTKTTTYVTTVTDHTSTVLPLTFRGKEILTTLVDSSTQVITATEYITETVIVTPTAVLSNNPQQINSLLLPALLQAQLLNPAQQQAQFNPLLGNLQPQVLSQDVLSVQDDKIQIEEAVERFKKRKPIEEDEEKLPQEVELEDVVEQPKPELKTRKKVKVKNGNKKPPDVSPQPLAETSIVTLYVSGRKPGDFSTILSTVTLGEESSVTIRKRDVEYIFDDIKHYKIQPSKLPEIGSSFSNQEDDFINDYVMPALNEEVVENEIETQSLESIVGDVSKYLTSDQYNINTEYIIGKPSKAVIDMSTHELSIVMSKSNKKPTGHFLSKSPAEIAPSQRKGQQNLDWSMKTVKNTDSSVFLKDKMSVRVKRQLDDTATEQPIRRRVKVRVPIQRRIIIDEELEPSEAQRSHDNTHQELYQTKKVLPPAGDEETSLLRKVKVLRKRPKSYDYDESSNFKEQIPPVRRRVAVRRRRPANSVVYENYFSQPADSNNNYYRNFQSESFPQETPEINQTETTLTNKPAQRKKKILITRIRPISSTISATPTVTTRRKVVVTRKRPIVKSENQIQPATIFSNFFVGLNTDYDYGNPLLNSGVEDSNEFISYNDDEENPVDSYIPPTEENGFTEEHELDSIRAPSSEPQNETHLSSNSYTDNEEQNRNVPESIVWFYEPTDEVKIDFTPTTTSKSIESIEQDFSGSIHSLDDEIKTHSLTATLPSLQEFDTSQISSHYAELKESLKTLDHPTGAFSLTPSSSVDEPESSSYSEEVIEFENAPKFVRPTRFSVTKKPSRVITGYPGTRRRQHTQVPPSLVSTVENLSTSSFKLKKTSKKYGTSSLLASETDVQPTSTLEVFNTELFDKHMVERLLPSDTFLAASAADDEGISDQSPSTTPTLAESTLSLEESPDTEPPSPPTTPTSFITTVVTSTRLRTYTYVVTRVNGDESIVTSSTSVKPKLNTLTLTIPVLAYTQTAPEAEEGRRFQLATKVMSNGVEVIVAGDRSSMIGGPEVLRRLTPSLNRPITLAPSTLSDAMMMLLPQGSSQESQDLVTKTFMTTYTYLTTLLEKGETVVSSREEVVSNVVTEEKRPSVQVTPTPVTKVTLTASPSLATGVFHTTYTYLNTLVDGEVPLVLTSRRTVSNTVTAPEDWLQPSEPAGPGQDTNTYLNTVSFTKTLADGLDFKIVSTKDVVTQVIITESDNKASSVVEIKPTALTTDVVKTYFVTYTYFSTMLDGKDTVVHSEVATSSDIVTEKFVLPSKKTSLSESVRRSEKISSTRAPEVDSSDNAINVFATKTYLTTFTYFTTLLQDNNGVPSTVVSSSTNVVQNIVTETLDIDLLDSNYLSSLRSSLQTDGLPIVATATLNDGQKMEITAVGEQTVKQTLSPLDQLASSFEETSSSNGVVTGSTIIFFDENDQIDEFSSTPTKSLEINTAVEEKNRKPVFENKQDSSEINDDSKSESLDSAESQALTLTAEDSESDESQQTYVTSILATSVIMKNGATLLPGAQVIKFKDSNGNISIIPVSDPVSKHPDGTHSSGTGTAVSNFLNLGSIGINSLNALGPVINAMAGLIKNNLKTDHRRRNDTIGTNANEPSDIYISKNPLLTYAGPKPPPSRSPIYIPVGGLAADSVAEESQNVAEHNLFPDANQRNKPPVVLGRPTMESPLLAGGIPISPGQVITANSDVIIGKHSVHGVRPPELNRTPEVHRPKPYRKDDIPLGMKPPPLPKNKPKWPQRDHTGQYVPLTHQPSRESAHRNPTPREPPYTAVVQNYDTINYDPELFKHPEYFKKKTPVSQNDHFIPPPRKEQHSSFEQRPQSHPHYPPQQHIQVYNNVPNSNFDYRPVIHKDTEALNSINMNVDYVNPIQHAPILLPDNTDFVDQSSVNPLLVNLQPSQVANVIIPPGSSTALIYSGEHSQKGEIFNDPSPYPNAEVDHVVDALSTARPGPEGEGITHAARIPINTNNMDVPVSPHGINVAAVNQQIYHQHIHPVKEHAQLTNHFEKPNQQLHQHNLNSNQVNHLQHEQNKVLAGNNNNNQNFVNQHYIENGFNKNYPTELGEYLQPPPPTRAEEDEYIFGDKTNEQEGGEVTQESNPRPLIPDQLPVQLTPNPSTSMPIDPVDDRHENSESKITYKRPERRPEKPSRPERPLRPNQDINFSVVNSKPVQLDGLSSINSNQAPIINGRPGIQGVNKFTDKSQATLAIGTPTNLKPEVSNVFIQDQQHSFKHNDRPVGINFINPALFAAINQAESQDNRPSVGEPTYFGNKKTQNKKTQPINDNTDQTLNKNEHLPPSLIYETPPPAPQSGNVHLESQANTPKPSVVSPSLQSQFERNSQQDDSVMGLSPPPPERYPIKEEGSPRPTLTLGMPPRRPPPRRPAPPYRFEPVQVFPEPPQPSLPPMLEPPKLPMLPETLSPPQPDEDYYHNSAGKKPIKAEHPEIHHQWNSQTQPKPIIVARPEMINPVLKGVLTVEERPQQPEVITADSKVVFTNVVRGHKPKPEIEIKITGSQPALQTVVVGKPVPVPVTDVNSGNIIRPTAVQKPNISPEWTDGFIVGSETIIDDHPHFSSPIKEHSSSANKQSSVLVTTGVTTIFGNYFTQKPTTTKLIKPTKSVEVMNSAVSVVVEPKENQTKQDEKKSDPIRNKDHHQVILQVEGPEDAIDTENDIVTAPPPSTFVVTHTQTTTVTTTQTTVVHSKGKEPSTHTLVLTKTKTSTLLDTVTEVHTLVKQTSILSTVTTTIPQVTSTVYSGSFTPEEPIVHGEFETAKLPDRKDSKTPEIIHDNDSIFVVMTDKKSGSVQIPVPDDHPIDISGRFPDEIPNDIPDIRTGSVLIHSESSANECRPECKASRNELCQKIDNVMRCVCRPGFTRMFSDRPCKPTYTYTMRLVLDRYGKDHIKYSTVEDSSSAPHQHLLDAARDSLDRAVMQSDLRDIYHGVEVRGFEPAGALDKAVVKFNVQLSDNSDESRLQDVLRKSLKSNNYSLGGTEVYADKEQIQHLIAEDFDECTDPKYHDCSEDAQCFNLHGTYTCSCKEGFSDLSPNSQYPGRVCSAEQIGCEHCNYHGTCYSRNDEELVCECFQWYGGATCQLNLKVLLLILVTVGVCLIVLLIVCFVLACMRRRDQPRGPPMRPSGGYRRYRAPGTGDRRAMISLDTSSEGSVDNAPPAYIKQAAVTAQRQKVLRKASKAPAPLVPLPVGTLERDRSLTVMIPRAKFRPAPSQPTNTLLTMSTFGPEQKLLNYLNPEGRSTPDKQGSRNTSRKPSNSTNQSEQVRSRKPSSQPPPTRKPSTGALVSAGFEVSATVGRTKELDEAFLQAPHTDLSQQGFNTIRTAESCIIVDIPPPPTLEAELEDIVSKVDRLTVSEARSYDETTIHPPTKSLHQDYDTKRLSSSSHRNDEGHTMVERDIGSTFLMPQTQLFKTDRGSDISNFDSL